MNELRKVALNERKLPDKKEIVPTSLTIEMRNAKLKLFLASKPNTI